MKRDVELRIAGDESSCTRALSAMRNLAGVEDVVLNQGVLRVVYNLRATSVALIVDALDSLGLTLELSRLQHLKLGLRSYREAILKEDLNNEMGWDSFVREIYVSRYRHRRHGRRDDRPRHWRQYTSAIDSAPVPEKPTGGR